MISYIYGMVLIIHFTLALLTELYLLLGPFYTLTQPHKFYPILTEDGQCYVLS